jgi:hypothetical protein
MANSKISALTSATTPLAGTETLPIVQSGTTKQVSVANLTAGRAVSFLNCTWGTTGYGDGSYLGVANTNPSAYGNRLVVGSYSETSATLNGLQAATTRAICTLWADGATNAAGVKLAVGWANGGQGPFSVYIGASAIAVTDTASHRPGADNSYSSGTASFRWSVIYSATALINTSDAKLKQQVAELSVAEQAVARRIKSLIRSFKFNDSVKEKGDGARIHIGVMAQDVKAAFEAEGLTAEKYALFCSDTWYEIEKDDVVQMPVKNQNGDLILDENGDPQMQLITNKVVKKYPHQVEGAVEVTQLGIRYDQLLAFVISAL